MLTMFYTNGTYVITASQRCCKCIRSPSLLLPLYTTLILSNPTILSFDHSKSTVLQVHPVSVTSPSNQLMRARGSGQGQGLTHGQGQGLAMGYDDVTTTGGGGGSSASNSSGCGNSSDGHHNRGSSITPSSSSASSSLLSAAVYQHTNPLYYRQVIMQLTLLSTYLNPCHNAVLVLPEPCYNQTLLCLTIPGVIDGRPQEQRATHPHPIPSLTLSYPCPHPTLPTTLPHPLRCY